MKLVITATPRETAAHHLCDDRVDRGSPSGLNRCLVCSGHTRMNSGRVNLARNALNIGRLDGRVGLRVGILCTKLLPRACY